MEPPFDSKMPKNKLGETGENAAAQYLLSRNYRLLAQNWRYRNKEIDLIASQANCLVIIEVKTRSTNRFGESWQAINRQKQRYLIYAANAFVEQNDWQGEVRFDVIGICHQPYRLEHIEDAFYVF